MNMPVLSEGEIERAAQDARDLAHFDYGTLAELFIGRGQGAKYRTMTYRRFAKGANAIRFAIEELPAAKLVATVLEADEARFGFREIRELYNRAEYPLPRAAVAQRAGTEAVPQISAMRGKFHDRPSLASHYRVPLSRPGSQ